MANGVIIPNMNNARIHFEAISSIKSYVQSLPNSVIDVVMFYAAPSDVPTGLSNWQYTMVTFKNTGTAQERDYMLLFYPNATYRGDLNGDTLTWRQITMS